MIIVDRALEERSRQGRPIRAYLQAGASEPQRVASLEALESSVTTWSPPSRMGPRSPSSRRFARDGVLTYADVELPEGRLVDRLRREQDEYFGATVA